MPGDTIIYPSLRSHGYACVTLDANEVWVCGDNFLESNDSKYYGPLRLELLQGKVVAKISWSSFVKVIHLLLSFKEITKKVSEEMDHEDEGEGVEDHLGDAEEGEEDLQFDDPFNEEYFDELEEALLVNPLTCFNMSRANNLSHAEWLFLRIVLTDDESTLAIPPEKREELIEMVDHALSFLGFDEEGENDDEPSDQS